MAEPARRLGLADQVRFAGYRTHDYADVVAAMDAVTMVVPGSDPTCRALVEAAYLGRPLVGSMRGAIPEIIRAGRTGWLVEERSESLSSAWRQVIDDPAARRRRGQAAHRDAVERFSPDRAATQLEAFYRRVLDARESRAPRE